MNRTGRLKPVRALFGCPHFRALCVSQVLAGLGEWLATMALIALVWARTHSAVMSGLVLVMRIAPAAIFGSYLGSIIDRWDRKRVMVLCNAGRAIVYGALPFVAGTAGVLTLALTAEIATIAYTTARDATLPRLVPKETLPLANAISMASSFGMMPVGSGLFALFGLAGAKASIPIALGVAGFVLGIATLIVGRINAQAMAAHADEPPAEKVSFRDGLRALREVYRQDAILRRVSLGAMVAATGGGAVITLGLAYVRSTLHAGQGAYSGLLMSFCAGAIAGVVSLQKLRGSLHKVFHAAIGVMGGILILMAMFPSTAMGMIMAFLFGASFVGTFLGGITILQDRVRDSLRGRAFGVAHSALRTGAVIMGVLSAWAAKAFGATPRHMGAFRMDGNQLVLGIAGLMLFAAAVTLLRPSRVRTAA